MRLLGYGGFTLLAILTLFEGQRLDRADLNVPLAYHGDVLLILPLVKCTIETGTHWHNDRLGAPGIQELHDFPIVDHLHFALLWLLGQVVPNYVVAFNLYHLASYPLTVLMTMIVLRSFNVSFAAAGLAGMLYAFLPYHYIRGLGHYFLSAYWTLPLTLWPALRLLHGLGLFHGRRTAIGTVLIAVMTACAGAYYAFFGCAVLAFAGLYAAIASRSWKPLASAIMVIALITAGGVANHIPTMIYQAKYGPNTEVTQRQPEEAEMYGLKLAQMVLPVAEHHWKKLSDVRAKYDSSHRPLQNENETATLGLIGSITLIALVVTLLFPGAIPTALRGHVPETSPLMPAQSRGHGTPTLIRPLAAMVLFLILLGTVGGIGSLFNFFVSPSVRSLNRISIVIAFFVFTALALVVDRSKYRWLIVLVLMPFGVWDETNRSWFRRDNDSYAKVREAWERDARFFGEIEARDPGGMIFCLPYVPYPETNRVGELEGYHHARGYLHSKTLRFSFGAMKNREVDVWQRGLVNLPPEKRAVEIAEAGFTGIIDETLSYRPILRAKKDATGLNRVSVLWLQGFVSFEPIGKEDQHRLCGRQGTMIIVNPTDATRTFKTSMILRSSTVSAGQLNMEGGEVWSETLQLSNSSPPIERVWIVPPGRHTVAFRYAPPREHVPQDSRDNVFFVANFTMTEVKETR